MLVKLNSGAARHASRVPESAERSGALPSSLKSKRAQAWPSKWFPVPSSMTVAPPAQQAFSRSQVSERAPQRPYQRVLSGRSVRHELLHVHRLHVEHVPQLAIADNADWGRIVPRRANGGR